MKTITFKISEELEAQLHGGRIALMTSNGTDVTLTWNYALPDGGVRKTILFGKVTDSVDPRDLAQWWDSEEGRKRRDEAMAHYKEFKKSRRGL